MFFKPQSSDNIWKERTELGSRKSNYTTVIVKGKNQSRSSFKAEECVRVTTA